MSLTLGLDVGGTKIASVVLDQNGTVVEQSTVPTDGRGTSVIAQIWNLMDGVAARHPLGGVGVAVPGNVDPKSGTVISAPNINWNHVDLQALIEPALRGSADVTVANDANAAAWAEYRFGHHEAGGSLAMITVGTGIGGGFIVNDQILAGAAGAGGEIGHLCLIPGGELCPCGSRGCWERYASGSALHRAAINAGWEPYNPSHQVLARAGDDAVAAELMRTFLDHFVRGISLVSSVLDPAVVVLGGGLGADRKFHAMVAESYAKTVVTPPRAKPRLRIAKLGAMAGAIGAADLAATAQSSGPA